MICAHRLPLRFESDRLRDDVTVLDDAEWIDHFVTTNYEGSWQVIPLRAPAGETHPVRMIYSDPTCKEFVDTPFLDRMPSVREALQTFECELSSVRLMKLAAGSRILEHRDHDLEPELGYARLHVPIVTNDGVEFRVGGELVDLATGECWYLRLSEPHSVRNDGGADRVHLVIDAVVDDWLSAMLP